MGSKITCYRTQANKISTKLPFLSYFWLYDTTQTGFTLPKNGTMDSSEACSVMCMCECRCRGGHKRESESLEPLDRGSGNQGKRECYELLNLLPRPRRKG